MAEVIQRENRREKRMLNLTSAQVTAISHFLHSRAMLTQLIEVVHKNKMYHIVILQDEIMKVAQGTLAIGRTYDISHLCWKMINNHLDGSEKKVCGTTSQTTFVHLDVERPKSSPSLTDLVEYKGVITSLISAPLKIYELDDVVELHLGYLMCMTKLTCPQVGQKVTVYNAHREIHDNKPCLLLCGKGFLRVLDGGRRECCSGSDLVGKCKMTHSNTMWLRRQLSLFEQKFTADFRRANNISDSAERLLDQCLEFHHPYRVEDTTSLSKEFTSHPHCCSILDEGDGYADYETLKKFSEVQLNPEKPWSHHNIESEDCMVGILTASVDSGYWVLSDATHSIPCLITGNTNDSLHGAVVLLTHCSLIVELFKLGNAVYYIHVEMKHIKVIPVPYVKQESRLKKVKVNEDCGKSSEEELDLLHHRVKASIDNSWLVLVHHKTATIKTSEGIFCCLLVSRLNKANETRNGESSHTERHYMVLVGKLIQYVPLLHNNMVYRLVIPHADLSSKYRLKQICIALPDVMGYRLPENCAFYSVESTDVAFLNSISDCYSVGNKELYKDLEPKELINIEGVICDRLHVDSKFSSEYNPFTVPGFGVSDGKTVILKLHDPLLNSENVVSLYLNNWGHRAYPLGLVPGARIQAMYVTMVMSQHSKMPYFKIAELTRLHVLEMADSINTSISADLKVKLHDWGPSCILTQEVSRAAPGTLLWGLIRGAKILKLTASVSCAKCSMSFKRGVCTSCTALPPTPKLTASARCYIGDVVGQVIIFMEGDLLLTFFGIKEPYWNVIAKLVGLDGREITLPETQLNDGDPPGKKLLQTLIDVSNKKMRCFYVFCRKMKTNANDIVRVPRLYCLDIQEPSARLLYKSLETS